MMLFGSGHDVAAAELSSSDKWGWWRRSKVTASGYSFFFGRRVHSAMVFVTQSP